MSDEILQESNQTIGSPGSDSPVEVSVPDAGAGKLNRFKNILADKKRLVVSLVVMAILGVGVAATTVLVREQTLKRTKATGDVQLSMVATPTSIGPGEETVVNVTLANPSGKNVTATDVWITWPTDTLRLSQFTPGTFFNHDTSGKTMICKVYATGDPGVPSPCELVTSGAVDGKVRIVLGTACSTASPWQCNTQTSNTGVLATLKFFAVASPANPSPVIAFEKMETGNATAQKPQIALRENAAANPAVNSVDVGSLGSVTVNVSGTSGSPLSLPPVANIRAFGQHRRADNTDHAYIFGIDSGGAGRIWAYSADLTAGTAQKNYTISYTDWTAQSWNTFNPPMPSGPESIVAFDQLYDLTTSYLISTIFGKTPGGESRYWSYSCDLSTAGGGVCLPSATNTLDTWVSKINQTEFNGHNLPTDAAKIMAYGQHFEGTPPNLLKTSVWGIGDDGERVWTYHCDYVSATHGVTNCRAAGSVPTRTYADWVNDVPTFDVPLPSSVANMKTFSRYPEADGAHVRNSVFGIDAAGNGRIWTWRCSNTGTCDQPGTILYNDWKTQYGLDGDFPESTTTAPVCTSFETVYINSGHSSCTPQSKFTATPHDPACDTTARGNIVFLDSANATQMSFYEPPPSEDATYCSDFPDDRYGSPEPYASSKSWTFSETLTEPSSDPGKKRICVKLTNAGGSSKCEGAIRLVPAPKILGTAYVAGQPLACNSTDLAVSMNNTSPVNLAQCIDDKASYLFTDFWSATSGYTQSTYQLYYYQVPYPNYTVSWTCSSHDRNTGVEYTDQCKAPSGDGDKAQLDVKEFRRTADTRIDFYLSPLQALDDAIFKLRNTLYDFGGDRWWGYNCDLNANGDPSGCTPGSSGAISTIINDVTGGVGNWAGQPLPVASNLDDFNRFIPMFNLFLRFEGVPPGTGEKQSLARVTLRQGSGVYYDAIVKPVYAGDGIFVTAIPSMKAGTYQLYVKGWGHLRKKFDITISGDPTQPAIDLSSTKLASGDIAGAADGGQDGIVDIVDIGRIVSYWDQPLDPAKVADINLDGKADIEDIGLIINHFDILNPETDEP